MSTTAAQLRALGTTARVVVDGPEVREAEDLLVAELAAIDRACSRFRDDSEITWVNRAAGRRVEIGPVFAQAVDVALRAARLTGGRVDPTVGTAVKVVGYDRDFDAMDMSGPAIMVTTARVPGWQVVELDRRAGTLRVPAGVELDLGATAKALAADRAAQRIAGVLGRPVLVALGGDVAIAGPPRAEGWPVRVTENHAAGPGAPGETVRITSGGLATSTTTVRRWVRGGDECNHLVDPATGQCVGGPYRTVTVAAATCVDANTASTAALVMGAEAPQWLAEHGMPARLVCADGDIVRTAGWPSPDFECEST